MLLRSYMRDFHQTALLEACQFPLNCTRAAARKTYYLRNIKTPLRLAVDIGQHSLSGGGKQRIGHTEWLIVLGDFGRSTHIGYINAQIGWRQGLVEEV